MTENVKKPGETVGRAARRIIEQHEPEGVLGGVIVRALEEAKLLRPDAELVPTQEVAQAIAELDDFLTVWDGRTTPKNVQKLDDAPLSAGALQLVHDRIQQLNELVAVIFDELDQFDYESNEPGLQRDLIDRLRTDIVSYGA